MNKEILSTAELLDDRRAFISDPVEVALQQIIDEINTVNSTKYASLDLLERVMFKYDIIVKEEKLDYEKIKMWREESLEGKNISVYDENIYSYHFFFELEHDAMGFKLMWEPEE
jgi:hypothetical protein